jgi:hypothetical protein
LVLIVHTEQPAGGILQQMEIGDGSWLRSPNLDEEYVRNPHTKPAPLVILLGCETGAPKVPFLGFVSRLRSSGAAIVVSSGSTLHATHAVQITVGLLKSLAALDLSSHASFGEVMRRLRCELLASGCPAVLCLTAYGDANWQIAR